MSDKPQPEGDAPPVQATADKSDKQEASSSTLLLNILATFSAGASAIAAICALVVSCQERNTPYKVAQYTTRWEAIQEYARASTAVQQEITRLQESMPTPIANPKLLSRLTDAQITEIAEEAYKIYPTWQRYVESSNSASALWSKETVDVIDAARDAGRRVGQCYLSWGRRIVGGAKTLSPVKFRREAAAKVTGTCRQALSLRGQSEFDVAANLALRAMTDELRENSDQFVPGLAHNAFD